MEFSIAHIPTIQVPCQGCSFFKVGLGDTEVEGLCGVCPQWHLDLLTGPLLGSAIKDIRWILTQADPGSRLSSEESAVGRIPLRIIVFVSDPLL